MEDNLDELNPIFMMANSGARGSFKQIRQLAGMRGLMANPKGEIIERPIKANFMEGLSVLEYFISTHGARKGLADTALRTADSGYLTRRLVDVAQDVIVREEDCKTKDHIEMALRKDDGSLNDNLIGRLAAKKLETKRGRELLKRNQEITLADVEEIAEAFGDEEVKIPVRSTLKCEAESGVCRSCYGVAPATGVDGRHRRRGGDHRRPVDRRARHPADHAHLPHRRRRRPGHHPGPAAHRRALRGAQTEGPGADGRGRRQGLDRGDRQSAESDRHRVRAARSTPTASRRGPACTSPTATRSRSASSSTRARSTRPTCWRSAAAPTTELYLVAEVQKVYRAQGVDINDKHIELIARQMLKKVRIESKGSTSLLPGQLEDRGSLKRLNKKTKEDGGTPAKGEEVILGITKASLATESFLSAASFQETTKVLTDAALEGKRDRLVGLKENVIIGKLIPAATGLKHYRTLAIEPAVPIEPPSEEGLLDEEELAAELGARRRRGAGRGLRALVRRGARGARAGDRVDLGRAAK